MKTDSADDVVVDESTTDLGKIANKEKEAEIKAAFNFDLK